MRFFVISIKKYFFTCLFFIFSITLILFSSSNLEAAQKGLSLWATSIVPTLLPFFISTELLCKTYFIQILGKILDKFIRPFFNVPGECTIAIIMGIISGYPVGAKVVCNLYEKKICSKAEAERLIAFTNNSGPIFILGTVGISLLGNEKIGQILLVSHILSSLIVGFIFRYWKKNQVNLTFRNYFSENTELVKISNLGEILGDAIKKSIFTVLSIGGFVVLFSIIISILTNSRLLIILSNTFQLFGIPYDFSMGFLTGLIELTNGLQATSNFYTTMPTSCILLCSLLLGFGGLSILLQVYSIISKSKISIKSYFYGKILHGFISVILTFLLLKI